tara:strand:+ start:464 stop:706 length:243 start_codon:yes stop_codon:yes gene_type:complete
MKKAAEDKFNELHNLVTEDFLKRLKSGEATTQDLKAACDWLKTNDITGVAYDGNPLDKLANVMPKIDPTLIQRRVHGKNF